jgi:subtilase family serine protease
VTVTVRNQGTGNIGGSFYVDLYKDSNTIPPVGEFGDIFCEINGLAAGATKTCTMKIAYAAAGNYKMWAQVDVDGYIPETDETNNRFGPRSISVANGSLISDLVIQSITTNPVSPQPHQSVEVTVTFRNQGTGHTAYPFYVDFYYDRASPPPPKIYGDITCYMYEGLEPEVTTTCVDFVSYPAVGSYNMWAQVDTNQEVAESSEVNNIIGPQSITVCSPPAAPVLSTPANAATGVSTTPALDWADVSGATSYDVQVCTSNTCTTVVTSANVATSTWTVSPALAQGTQYYWRVKANNACGPGSYSAVWSFTTTCPLPAAPVLSTPANGATGVSTTPALDWADVSGATSYDVQVCTSNTCTT